MLDGDDLVVDDKSAPAEKPGRRCVGGWDLSVALKVR